MTTNEPARRGEEPGAARSREALLPLRPLPPGDADARTDAVEEALYLLATGFIERTEKQVKLRRVEYDGARKSAEYDVLEPQAEETLVPPNVTAIRFWLSCRRPEVWGAQGDPGEEAALGRLERFLDEVGRAAAPPDP